MRRDEPIGVTEDVAGIRAGVSRFFRQSGPTGYPLSGYTGVYVFFDYDDEPIYVGQTYEGLGARVGRHLTNQRTDAVAMNVLDPFEVASIEVYPLHHRSDPRRPDRPASERMLNELESTVFQKVLAESQLGAVLNEKDVAVTPIVTLPTSYRQRIIPDDLFESRRHPDVRIARRASTIARLAQVISERDVSPGLRRTLLVQARRLEKLAAERFEPFRRDVPVAAADEETGETVD